MNGDKHMQAHAGFHSAKVIKYVLISINIYL